MEQRTSKIGGVFEVNVAYGLLLSFGSRPRFHIIGNLLPEPELVIAECKLSSIDRLLLRLFLYPAQLMIKSFFIQLLSF